MRRPKLTIRALMALTVVFSLALGLGIPAYEVRGWKDYHIHTGLGVGVGGEPVSFVNGGAASPFWPRYWRRLRGLPWNKVPLCPPRPGTEACSYARPEIVIPLSNGMARTELTPELSAEYDRRRKQWERQQKP